MPLMNSEGALKQQTGVTTTLGNNQFLTVLGPSTEYNTFYIGTDSGNSYFGTSFACGISKLDNTGRAVYQKSLSGGGTMTALSVDSSENVYASGNGTNFIIKYNMGAAIQWQQNFNSFSGSVAYDSVVDPSGNVYILSGDGSSRSVLAKYNSSGTLLLQKNILKSTTFPQKLGIDTVNGQLLVFGTDSSTTYSTIYTCTYPYALTGPNTILVQSSATTNYSAFAGAIYSDGTYIYQLVQRGSSQAYVKLNQTTGAVSYSYKLTIDGYDITPVALTIDTNGYMYVAGYSSTNFVGICKIDRSTGNIIWSKTISNATYGTSQAPNNLSWSNNFLYFGVSIAPSNVYTGYIRIRDDGSVRDGTYGTYFTFTTVTATKSALNSDSTSTTTDSIATPSYTSSATSRTQTNTTYTITTSILP